jgi:UMF1 family MFS transporter
MPTAEIPEMTHDSAPGEAATTLAPQREIVAWILYHLAYSGVPAVVSTAIFNAYFVEVVCGGANIPQGTSTLLWTVACSIANFFVMVNAQFLGTFVDTSASKKRLLACATVGCIITTGMLALAGPGAVLLAMILTVASGFTFSTAEDMIAAFLPELCPSNDMGRISAFGASAGHLGSLLALGVCLGYVQFAQAQGQTAPQFVPVTMLIVSVLYIVLCLPTFLWLKERAQPQPLPPGKNTWQTSISRLQHTIKHAARYKDLVRLLASIVVYTCGTSTIVVLAAVYAHQVMKFTTSDTIVMIAIVNLTASIGAIIFGYVQDKIGSVKTLATTLVLWLTAIGLVFMTEDRTVFWIASNLIGMAIGSSYSVGRALVGQFSPKDRAGEFFGLWGLACKLAAVVGPLNYGLIAYASGGNQRIAIGSTALFFVIGMAILFSVNEKRGKEAALIG